MIEYKEDKGERIEKVNFQEKHALLRALFTLWSILCQNFSYYPLNSEKRRIENQNQNINLLSNSKNYILTLFWKWASTLMMETFQIRYLSSDRQDAEKLLLFRM